MTKKSETADPRAIQAAATTLTDQTQPQCTINDAIGQAPRSTEIDAIFKKVVAALPAGTKEEWQPDGSVMVQCPAHDDRKPSLHISKGDKGVILYCHADSHCQTEAILARMGLKPGDLTPTTGNGRRIEKVYDYHDADGSLLFQVVRFDPKDFRQRRPDGKGGWIWNTKGVKRVLYMLPGLLAADPDDWVFVCEGEKAALAISMQPPHGLGLTATANPGGARKWHASYSQHLKGRKVAILPDNDGPGREHANRVYRSLQSIAADVRIVALPVKELQEDPYDFVHKYKGTADELLALVESTPEAEKRQTLRQVEWTADELLTADFPEPKWAIQDILPEGLTILAGRPKLGKSFLAMQWALSVGTGGMAFGRQVEQGKVLYLALEDNPRRLQKRQKTQNWPAGANVTFRVVWPDLLDGGLEELRARLESEPHALVVIDTLSRAVRFQQKEVEEATSVLSPLQHLALDFGCSILLIDHHRKSASTVDDVIDEVLGSTGKAAVADAILGLFRDRGKQGATLKITGRDMEDAELVIKWDRTTCCWQLLGDAKITPRTEGERKVLEVIDELGEATTQQIADELGLDKGNVSRTLGGMLGRLVEPLKKQGREVPYKRITNQ